MRKHSNDRLQGTLDMLVLKALASQGRMHDTRSLCGSNRFPLTFSVLKRALFIPLLTE
jgi:hypothetical protein